MNEPRATHVFEDDGETCKSMVLLRECWLATQRSWDTEKLRSHPCGNLFSTLAAVTAQLGHHHLGLRHSHLLLSHLGMAPGLPGMLLMAFVEMKMQGVCVCVCFLYWFASSCENITVSLKKIRHWENLLFLSHLRGSLNLKIPLTYNPSLFYVLHRKSTLKNSNSI